MVEERWLRIMVSLSQDVGSTCHESYIRTKSHIGPEMFYFNEKEDATTR